MKKVFCFSTMLILGILASQMLPLSQIAYPVKFLTMVFLGYIMIEVGLEFTLQKHHLRQYGKDYLIATAAATLPWIFCSLYFYYAFSINLTDASIIGRFAAPTSAGVLFSMLAAAGLTATWMFKKARILAILDDIDTVVLIVPLQMIKLGFAWRSLILIGIVIALLYIAWRFLHQFRLPTSRPALLMHAIVLVIVAEWIEHITSLNIEILLPAFVLGCVIKNPHLYHAPTFMVPKKSKEKYFDDCIKFGYMFLVGCSLPPINFSMANLSNIALHVIIITFLSNLGKIYPLFCYKKDAGFTERAALTIALWPRGEVGAGVLMIAAGYALPSIVVEVAELSLALNLTLTGLFIYMALALMKKAHPEKILK